MMRNSPAVVGVKYRLVWTWKIISMTPPKAVAGSILCRSLITDIRMFSCWHIASHSTRPAGVCLLGRKRTAMLRRGNAGFLMLEPTLAVHCGNGFDAWF